MASILGALPRFRRSEPLWNLSEMAFQIEGWKHRPGFPDYIFVIVSHEEKYSSPGLGSRLALPLMCHGRVVFPLREQKLKRKQNRLCTTWCSITAVLKIMGNLSSLKWARWRCWAESSPESLWPVLVVVYRSTKFWQAKSNQSLLNLSSFISNAHNTLLLKHSVRMKAVLHIWVDVLPIRVTKTYYGTSLTWFVSALTVTHNLQCNQSGWCEVQEALRN